LTARGATATGIGLERRRLVEWVRATASGRMWPLKPWAGPVAQQARSSVTASVVVEEKAKSASELLDPRVETVVVAVKVGGERSAPGGEEMGPRQG